MAARNIVQSSHPGHTDTARHQTKVRFLKQDEPTDYAAVSETLSPCSQSLQSFHSLCFYCSVPCLYPVSQLAAEWMDAGGRGGRGGGRVGGKGRRGEVNEIPMRCQGVLAVRRGEWEKRPEGRGVAGLTVCKPLVWDGGHPALPAWSPPVVLTFAKSAQDVRGMFRRGGEGEKGVPRRGRRRWYMRGQRKEQKKTGCR